MFSKLRSHSCVWYLDIWQCDSKTLIFHHSVIVHEIEAIYSCTICLCLSYDQQQIPVSDVFLPAWQVNMANPVRASLIEYLSASLLQGEQQIF